MPPRHESRRRYSWGSLFLFNIENLVLSASPNRREHSAWRIAKKKSKREMVNGEQQQSQRMMGLPFTAALGSSKDLLITSRFALCAERFASRGQSKAGLF